MSSQTHWDNIYDTKTPTQVSWYQEHANLSLQLIQYTGVDQAGEIIDIGGGASTMVDDLLANGFKHVTVLDISPSALQTARQRLGAKAAQVTWLHADVTRAQLPRQGYDIWHDRATFHFLTQPDHRRRYIKAVQHSVKPGGHVIVATFALDGPTMCSGLDVIRYSPESLHGEFGDSFELVNSAREAHVTPFGKEQRFIYCYCRKG